ncbi:helix-turn-helix domain-containing protein [Priestia sp. SB1]|uniref:helix-turn-helix domain-containing protein n=1 Tax=Priestia sp. SB1 TaxID=3132359 RepID=UPI00316CE039
MQIKIDELLAKKDKTRYWLAKEVGVTYPNLCKLADGKTESIKFEIMEKICSKLECSPNELLNWKTTFN